MTGWRHMQQGRNAQRFVAPEAGVYEIGPSFTSLDPAGSSTVIPFDTRPLHTTDVIQVTPTAFAFCCGCGVSGPFRPTRAEAQHDADQHPAPNI